MSAQLTSLDDLETLADDASPGPWVLGKRGDRVMATVAPSPLVGESRPALRAEVDGPRWKQDAAYIAAVDPQTVLALIERVKRAEAAIAKALPLIRDRHCVEDDHDEVLGILGSYAE